MIKRELKINFKSFIIWLAILIGLFATVFLLYPAIIQNDNFKRMDELMSIFPEEVLTAFNMDLSSLESVFGWLKSEGFVFILLITGCYSGMLGAEILRKEYKLVPRKPYPNKGLCKNNSKASINAIFLN